MRISDWSSDVGSSDLKGKREPHRIFALLGGPELMEDPEVRSTIAIMHDLLSAYRLQAWDAAVQAVDALSGRRLSHLDLETFRSLYRGRIEQFHRDPPAPGWAGAIGRASWRERGCQVV